MVRAEEVRGTNAYDPEVAERRAKRTLSSALDLLTNYERGPWEGSVLLLLGDIVNGIIHEELRDTALTSVTRDVVTVLPILRDYIDAFASTFGKVHVACVAGNHGRLTQNKRFKGAQEQNFEWLLYHFLASLFATDTRVSFQIADSPDIELDILGTRFLLTHGDRFNGGGGIGGIWSPIMRGVARAQQRETTWRSRFDYMVMGHWHQLIFGSQFIINGAMKGYCEYASTLGFHPQTPRQALWTVHRGKGITMERKVLCDGTDQMHSGLPRSAYLKGF